MFFKCSFWLISYFFVPFIQITHCTHNRLGPILAEYCIHKARCLEKIWSLKTVYLKYIFLFLLLYILSANSQHLSAKRRLWPNAVFCGSFLLFMFYVCNAVMSVHCSLVVTCWDRANLLALLYVMFTSAFVTFWCGVLGQVWYKIVSIPYLCLHSFFEN